MKNHVYQMTLALLVSAVITGCSDKTATAPAPAAPASSAATHPAQPAPSTATSPAPSVAIGEPSPTGQPQTLPAVQSKQAELICGERKIVLQADCKDLYGPRVLACTRQVLTFSTVSGDKLAERVFARLKGEGGEPDTVEEKIAAISCVRSKANENFIVTSNFNGGNCPDCEWYEVYDWSGKQIGTTRNKKNKAALVDELVGYASASTAPANVFGNKMLDKFYSAL